MKRKEQKEVFAKRRKIFVEHLLGLLRHATGCGIQHGGCPCNSCFHSWAQDELGLNEWLAHMFWMVVLALRGDYKQKDIMESTKEFCRELVLISGQSAIIMEEVD